jgi:tRNA pseudouridine65 synthase
MVTPVGSKHWRGLAKKPPCFSTGFSTKAVGIILRMETDTAQELCILYSDKDLIAIDKPAGLLVHASALDAHERRNAVDLLRRQTGEPVVPVHRLDKGTSGVLLFARHAAAARQWGMAFDAGQVGKRYLALVRGWPAEQGVIDHPLARDPELPSAGQLRLPAVTAYERIATFEWPFQVDAAHASSRYALVRARPQQGRRHQIRRHFKHIAHPLVGDATHGKGVHNRAVAQWLGTARLWLHAEALELDVAGQRVTIAAPPGPEWSRLLAAQA